MNEFKALDPETIKAAGFGTERPLSDHPEVLRNLLLRGTQEDWAKIVVRIKEEPEFRDHLRNVLTTIPHPEGWDEADESGNATDPFVESAAAPLFEDLLKPFTETPDPIRKASIYYIRNAVKTQEFDEFRKIADCIKDYGPILVITAITEELENPKAGEEPIPILEFIQACHTTIVGTESIDPVTLQQVKTACRQLASEILGHLPDFDKRSQQGT